MTGNILRAFFFLGGGGGEGSNAVQFSSGWCLCAWESLCAFHHVSQKFLWHCLGNSSSVHMIDDGLLSSFQGLRAFSFHAFLHQVIDCVVPLALCPSGSVSCSSTLQIMWDSSHLWWLLSLPVGLSAWSVCLTLACLGWCIHRGLGRWMLKIGTCMQVWVSNDMNISS